MGAGSADLDFAYRYPFSSEAREIVNAHGDRIDPKYLEMAGRHIDNATSRGIDYTEISMASIKTDYVMTYLYSRMLLSALRRSDLIKLYAMAEARRSSKVLNSNSDDIIKVASELGIRITGTFNMRKDDAEIEEQAISFIDYAKYAPAIPSFGLVNQKLSGGTVVLSRSNMAKVLEQAIISEIMKGLPIKSADLPKQVVDYSKGLKFRVVVETTVRIPGKRSEEWIEGLLNKPIADVRHRTVNLILAPYLTNTKGLSVDQAVSIIHDYIEKCKQIDPHTRINDSYIRYQCDYAKRKGMRPLSLDRAKELLDNQIDFEEKAVKGKKV